ncbi:MAG: hydroxyacid dehydrogenase [Thermoplasmata archaeon]|nr:hydroxyacid dehydrogenase [Thermoplasmata archaeon]
MKILACDGISPEGIAVLKDAGHDVDEMRPTPEELLQIIGAYDGLMVRSKTKVTAAVIEKGINLKAIGRAGVGVDNVDLKAASGRRISVVNAPTGATISVAELTFAHMLALARRLNVADSSMREGRWLKKDLKGTELYGKVLGLIGVGRIGKAVAERARIFGMDVIAYDPFLNEEQIAACFACKVDIDDVLGRADFISLHLPLTAETKNIIGERELKRMKRTAYLINCSRGGLVDEAALARALRDGTIAGTGLDTYAEEPPKGEVLEMPNSVMTPHIGASTVEGQARAGAICAEQLLKALSGERPDHQANRF